MTKARDIASAIPAPSTVSSAELGYLDGVTSAIQTQVDAKIAKTLTTTTGDIIYASGANTPARRAIGSTGNVLTVAGGVPTWAAPAGGGKVLQVVQGTKTSSTSTTSTTFVDTGLSVAITPTLNTSKIMVFVSHPFVFTSRTGASDFNLSQYNLMRDSTQLIKTSIGVDKYSATNGDFYTSIAFSYLDSPATTSSTTYKTQFLVQNASVTNYFEASATYIHSIVAMEIGA